MEISNEQKAKEIAKKLSHPNIDSFGDGDDEFDTRFYHVCKDAALDAMQWKDEQFKIVVSKLLKKLAKYDMLDATLCASGLLNLSKQEAQQYIKNFVAMTPNEINIIKREENIEKAAQEYSSFGCTRRIFIDGAQRADNNPTTPSVKTILEILRINSNIQDRSNPHWIAEQIFKQLNEKKQL